MKSSKKILLATVILSSFILSACKVELVATYDAVILGSGISSMVAALELDEKGKRVLIVEESGITGGNKRLLSGGVSFLNVEANDDVDTFVNDIVTNNMGQDNFYTKHLVEQSMNLPSWLTKYNIELTSRVQLPGNSVARTAVSPKGKHSGKEVVLKLEEAIKTSNVTIDYNTKISKIELQAKNKYQVGLEKQTSVVNVRTSTIIFAEDAKNVYDTAIPIRSTAEMDDSFNENIAIEMSTGMSLLEKLKVEIDTSGEMNIIDTYNSDMGVLVSPAIRTFGGMLVNNEGNRFVNEMTNNPDIIKEIIKQPNQEAYLLYDTNVNNTLSFLSEYYEGNIVVASDSISDLASKTGMSEEALYATITKYSSYVKNQNDESFNRPFMADSKAFANENTDDKLYAIKVQPYLNILPAYANVTNNFEVIKDTDILQGVYAVGDSARNVQLKSILHGTEITYAIVMGQDVAAEIETYLLSIEEPKQ